MDAVSVPLPDTPEPVPPAPDEVTAGRPWRLMSLTDTRSGYVIMLRPSPPVPGRDDRLYWCGDADRDSFVNWLSYHDPGTDAEVPARVAIYTTRVDAVVAWDGFLADRRSRGLSPPVGFAEVMPLAQITHFVALDGRPTCGAETASAVGERDV